MKAMSDRLKVLVIDDEAAFRENIVDFLEDIDCEVHEAEDGVAGLERLAALAPDVVLLDLNMPRLKGFEFLARMREVAPETPVLVISGVGLVDEAVRAVRAGAWDYLSKPIESPDILEQTINRALDKGRLIRERRLHREHLEDAVQRRTQALREEVEVRSAAEARLVTLNAALERQNREIIETQTEIIGVLGGVIETRSLETGHHVRRVGELACLLARKIGLAEAEAALLRLAAPLHDIGKIGVPDAILNKPGRLTPEEFAIVKGHAAIGHDILRGSSLPIMQASATIAHQHHERWDGSGYPRNLAGQAIHPYGRLVGLVDCFDALNHDQVYRRAWPLERVLSHIGEERGRHFDPELADLLLTHIDEALAVNERYPEDSTK